MVNCPRCGKEITHLKCKSAWITYGTYTVKDQYAMDDYDMERQTFCCPECNKEVCYAEEDARKLLKGGT